MSHVSDNSALNEVVAEIEANAYRRGADDAIRAMKSALQGSLNDLFAEVAASLIFTKTLTKTGPKRAIRVRENSNAAKVLAAITATPGLSGANLHRALDQIDPPVNERTMRTALRRLRVRGLIKKDNDGGWIRA